MRGIGLLAALLPALGLLAACRTGLDRQQLDRLQRGTGARTVVHEPDFSLYSPFSPAETQPWLELVQSELAEVARLLEVDPAAQAARDGPVLVELHPVAGIRGRLEAVGDSMRVEVPDEHPTHGIQGVSQGRRAIVYVEPEQELVLADGRSVRGTWGAGEFRSTLRHELAHVLAESAGLEGEPWLTEGLAELLEVVRLEAHGPQVDPLALRLGRRAARGGPPLAAVLGAREDLAAISSGRAPPDPEWRPRLRAFFAFLLERELEQGGSLRSALERAQRAGREQLAGLEPEWRRWLEWRRVRRRPSAQEELGVPSKRVEGSEAEAGLPSSSTRP